MVRSRWTRIQAGDKRFFVWTVIAPLGLFLIPALFGHPIMAGDGTQQNYPLRVLAGTDLSHGHLPLWDPYIWSGTPLLAGFNAGALYPGVLLFAVLPAQIAWSLNQALVLIVAGSGLYCFLRVHKVSPGGSTVGAVSWVFGGFFIAQLVHIDLVQGWGWVVWVLIALQRLASGPKSHRARWCAALGVFLGLVILTGDPEAMVEGAMLSGLYAMTLIWRYRQSRFVLWVLAGLALGGVVGAAQWMPGLVLAMGSQRASASYGFFVGGSVGVLNIPLLFVPYLLGGFGRFGIPYYIGNYSLTELSGYAGIVALGAVFSLPARWKRDSFAKDWRPWYLIGAVGMILALGQYTPISHLMFHVPLYRLLRLPSRNLAWVDLSLAVLAGFWCDRVLRAGAESGIRRSLKMARAFAVIPAAVVGILLIIMLADGPGFVAHISGATKLQVNATMTSLRVVSAIEFAVAISFAIIVWRSGHFDPKKALALLTIVMCVDLGFYASEQAWLYFPPSNVLSGSTPYETQLGNYISYSNGSRFAIFDPNRIHPDQINLMGEPDLNLLDHMLSVEGYGSIIPSKYGNATSTHQQLTLSTSALSDGTFDSLSLSVLLTPFQSFATLVSSPKVANEAERKAMESVTGGANPLAVIPPPGNEPTQIRAGGTIGAGSSRSWFIGQSDSVAKVNIVVDSLVLNPGVSPVPDLQLGVVAPNGQVTWQAAAQMTATSDNSLLAGCGGYIAMPQTISQGLPTQPKAVGIDIRNLGSTPVDISSISYTDGNGLVFNLKGALSQAIAPSKWTYRGTIGNYPVYMNKAVLPIIRLSDPSMGKLSSLSSEPWGSQSVTVSTPVPARLIRSVSYQPGWTASLTRLQSNGTSARLQTRLTQRVAADGLIQKIFIPAGRWKVHFSYHPSQVDAALLLSLGGLVLAFILIAFDLGKVKYLRAQPYDHE